MKKAVNVESNFFDISLKEQMLSVKKVGFDGVFFDWTDNEEFAENVNFAREIGL
jgi:coproporphyrinogen III oxidase